MKRLVICSVAAAMLLVAGKVGFCQEKEKGAEVKKSETGPAKGAGGVDRMEMMKKAQERRIAAEKEKHDAFIKKLDDVKKLAIEEKATKTAAAIDKLIAEENDAFKAKVERQERGMEMIREKPKGPPEGAEKKEK